MSGTTERATDESEYVVRQYEPEDRDAVLALYDEVYDRDDEAWFDWRYVDNPYLDAVPICVAESGGEVVGARPSLPFPLRVGGERVLAIAQVDPMVAPDHRRQGLFSRMVTHVYNWYATREPAVSIGFPNEAVKGALEKLAGELSLHSGVTRTVPEHYRVQNPGALAAEKTDSRLGRTAGRVATPVARTALSLRTWSPEDRSAMAVERSDGVPADELAAVAGRRQPDRAHADRDEAFYRWRFANPRFDYETFVAEQAAEPIAAVVVGRQRDAATDVVHVTEVAPLVGGGTRHAALDHLFARVCEASADADVIAVAGEAVPEELLGRYGFVHAESFPLSWVTTPSHLVARPIVADDVDEWRVGGQDLSDPDRWLFGFCEREIG